MLEEKCVISKSCTTFCSRYKDRGQCPAWYQKEKDKKKDKRRDEIRYSRKS